MPRRPRPRLFLWAVLGLLLAVMPGSGALAAPEQELRARLLNWTEDFNAGRAERICDLFSLGLVARFQGVAERGYDAQCRLLRESLGRADRRFHYDLAIHEIIVAGGLAVSVR